MVKEEFEYIGYVNNHYCFKNEEGKVFKFARIRTDLIFTHELYKDKTKGQRLIVYYFVSSQNEVAVPILSDLESIHKL